MTPYSQKGREELRKKNCVAKEAYVKWLTGREIELKMPYALFPPPSSSLTDSIVPIIEYIKDPQVACDQLKIESDEWKKKFHASDVKKMELLRQLKEKDELLLQKDVLLQQKDGQLSKKNIPVERTSKKRRVQEDLFSYNIVLLHEYSNIPATLGAWKGIIDKLIEEKTKMQKYYKSKIRKLKGMLYTIVGTSSYSRIQFPFCLRQDYETVHLTFNPSIR